MDTKRTVIMFVILLLIPVAWMRLFPPAPAPAPVAPAPSQPAEKATAPQPAPAREATGTTPTAAAASEASKPAAARPAEQRVSLEGKQWKATFSSWGGTLVSFELKDPQYREKLGAAEGALDLVRAQGRPELVTSFEDSGFQLPADAAWQIEKQSADELVFAWQSEGVRVTKRFKADGGARTLAMSVDVANTGAKTLGTHVQVRLFGKHDFEQKGGLGRQAPNIWVPSCFVDGKLQKKTFEEVRDKGALRAVGDLRWVAIQDRYFMLALAPAPDPSRAARTCMGEVVDSGGGVFQASLLLPERRIEPGQTGSLEAEIYAGPKIIRDLSAVRIAGQDPRLDESVDYGWLSPISRVMLLVLLFVHKGVASWGVAIIALTLLVKLLTYPLNQKAMKSGKEMAKLKPEMEKLQKRFKDDKQRLSAETMNLYKTHGVNPLGGCLPMLIQFPVWMALYATLGNAVELYRSKFLWMPDLTRADPFYITPIAMGIFMFLQQRITPMPTDNEQQKMMMYMMPLVFTFMSLWFPAGLTVYILTNTLLTMAQQWWMNRSSGEKKVLKPARAS